MTPRVKIWIEFMFASILTILLATFAVRNGHNGDWFWFVVDTLLMCYYSGAALNRWWKL